MATAQSWFQSLYSQRELLLPVPPFLRLLLTCIRVNLVPHPTQDVRGGFGGHNEWFDHCWWQLAENSTNSPCHPTLLVLPCGCVVDGQGCVCNALWRKISLCPHAFFFHFTSVNVVELLFICLPLSLQYKLWLRLLSGQQVDEPGRNGSNVLPSLCPSHQELETPCHRLSQLLSEETNTETAHFNTSMTEYVLFTVKRRTPLYLNGSNHPVGELQGSHGCGGSKGGSASLKSPDYPTILSVLLDREPNQIPEAVN